MRLLRSPHFGYGCFIRLNYVGRKVSKRMERICRLHLQLCRLRFLESLAIVNRRRN